jgi:hypothetical protein
MLREERGERAKWWEEEGRLRKRSREVKEMLRNRTFLLLNSHLAIVISCFPRGGLGGGTSSGPRNIWYLSGPSEYGPEDQIQRSDYITSSN